MTHNSSIPAKTLPQEFPHFFHYLRENGLRTASVHSWEGISHLCEQDCDHCWANSSTNFVDDKSTVEEALRLLAMSYEDCPDCLFVHLDQVDVVGHHYGYGIDVTAYVQAIELADRQLGEFLSAIDDRKYSEEWLIVVITDHGGTSKKDSLEQFEQALLTDSLQKDYHGAHGLDIPQHRQVFLIFAGNAVQPREILPAPPIVCVAPTILQYFTIPFNHGHFDGYVTALRS